MSKTANNYEEDLKNLEKFYCKPGIKKIAVETIGLYGNELIEGLSKRYNLNPNKFHNYIPKELYNATIRSKKK